NPSVLATTTVNGPAGTLTLHYAPGVVGVTVLTVQAADVLGQTITRSFTVTVSPPPALEVTSLTKTTSGFVAQFDRNLDPSVLNLYDQGGALGPADVTLVGATAGAVAGSIVVDPGLRKITFIKTGEPLVPDTYTVMLRST